MELRHDLVRAMVRHFLGVFEYKGVPVRVTTKPEHFIRNDQQRSPQRRYLKAGEAAEVPTIHGWMIPYPESKMIFVNTEFHESYKALVDTCAHEALHASRWLTHPQRFQPTVDAAVAEFLGKG